MIIYKYLSYNYGIELLKDVSFHLSGMDLHNDPFEALPATKYIPPTQTKSLFRNAIQTKGGRDLLKNWGISDDLSAKIINGTLTASIITMRPSLLLASAALLHWLKKEKNIQDTQISGEGEEFERYNLLLSIHWKEVAAMRMCCFSTVPDNILMWGHYAKHFNNKEAPNHSGIVVAFCKEEMKCKNAYLRKVSYKNTRMPLPHRGSIVKNYINKLVTQKSRCWEYENEWRLLVPNATSDKLPFRKESVKAIILGCDMQDKQKELIVNIQRRLYPHALVLQAQRDNYEYKITIPNLNNIKQ